VEKFIELFKEDLGIEDENLKPEDKFRELPIWDSLAVLTTLALVNSEYDITISREEFNKIETMKELWSLIQSKI
jgi:acyl carrier protein